jgi:Fe-S cluster assembly protein SufB
MPEDRTIQELGLDEYKFGFHDPEEYFFKTPRKGIDPEIVAMISKHKNEPEWMLEFRLKAGVVLREADPTVGRRPLGDGFR